MKRTAIIIFCIIVFLVLITIIFFIPKHKANPQDILQATDKEIISMLAQNKDGSGYMQEYSDFRIQDKIILTKDSILAGQNGQNFKEVYQGLSLENNRYLKVDLTNATGDRGLVAVLDFKTMQTIKAYGIILLKAGSK